MKISAAWEQDDSRAPVAPARVAQYEGYCISHLLEKEFFVLHIHFFCGHFLNDLELLVWVEWK
jgi:hypothetical protein